MQEGNYIKIFRSFLDWEWYGNINTKILFLHMLLKANWKDRKFEGKIIPRGSFVSSIGGLADEVNLTPDEVRTAISHLIMTGEVTKQSTNKFTVFTVVNWDMYQDIPKQVPSNSQTITKLFPTIEEKKEREEGKNIPPISPSRFMEFWNAYPKQVAFLAAEEAYHRILLDDPKMDEANLVATAANYAEAVEIMGTSEIFLSNPDNFLKNGKYLDYLPGEYKKPVKKPGSKKGNSFNEFPQRDYDFDALEKELLSN